MSAPGAPSLEWTARTWVAYGGGGALLALAILAHDPIPLFAAIPLLLAPAAAFLAAPGAIDPIPLQWAEEGSAGTVVVRGRIRLPVSLDARDLVVELPIPEGVDERIPLAVEYLRGEIGFRAEWTAREPVLGRVDLPDVRWRDAFGLLERVVPLIGSPLPLERYPPEIGRLGGIRLDRTIVLPGETRSRAIGESGEFFGVRPAAPGDSTRRLNWSASARRGRLYTNEFNLERTGDVLLFVDARPTRLGSSIDRRLLGVSRAAAAGIAAAFLREKARVGLAIFGEFVETIPLGSGRTQRYRIREALLRARVAGVAGPSERGAVAVRRVFPPGVTTIVLSSLADDSSDLLVRSLRRRGFAPIVLSPSPITARPHLPRVPRADGELADRVAGLERRLQLSRVWRDAPVVDWTEFWSLAGFARFLEVGAGARRRP